MEYVAKEAKKHGYDFTAIEMKSVAKDHYEWVFDDNLSDVAGGGIITSFAR